MANPHGLPINKIKREEKRLNITPKEGQSLKDRRRTITLKKSRIKGGAERDARFRKKNREKIRARDRDRVRTPEQLKHQAEYQAKRRIEIKAARERPPSKRTKKQKKLVQSWEKEMRALSTKRELTKQQKVDREAWRKSLTPEQRIKEARRSAKNILGATKRRSRREYTTTITGKGGKKRKVKKIAYAMSLLPDDLKAMEDSLFKNQLKWFKKGGVLNHWDHIVAFKAKDKFGNRIASGLTTPENMRFMDPKANLIKSNWLTSSLLKSVERNMMKAAKARNLGIAGFGALLASSFLPSGSKIAEAAQTGLKYAEPILDPAMFLLRPEGQSTDVEDTADFRYMKGYDNIMDREYDVSRLSDPNWGGTLKRLL